MHLLAAMMVALLGLAPPALAAGDAAAGRRTADTWCVGCHLVGDENKAAMLDVPTFPEIGQRATADALRSFLSKPHPPNPTFRLTPQDVENLVGFIRSTGKK